MWRRLAMMVMFLNGAVVGPCLAAGPSTVRIEKPWARVVTTKPPGTGGLVVSGVVYATITNPGASPDALVRAGSDVARGTELHEMTNEGGVMAMRPVPRLDLPAGGRLELKPGSYHVMLLGLTRELHPGNRIKVTFTFEKAGALTVEVPVQ